MDIRTELDQVINEIEQEGINPGNIAQKAADSGLGDTLERIFTKFGITEEKIQQFMGIRGCGCGKRKKFLNTIFPYRKKPEAK